MVSLDGSRLSLPDVDQVSTHKVRVEIATHAVAAMQRSRAVVENLASGEAPVYAVNTGVGLLADVRVPPEELEQLQRNVVRSHACGVGDPLARDEVRAMMLIRANVLAKGFSGIRPLVAERLCDLLNRGVTPVVPSQGSVGASGDLAPLAHIALVLIGEGEAEFEGTRSAGGDALARAGIEPIVLASKEGISLVNGTQAMLAVGCLELLHAETLAHAADTIRARNLAEARRCFEIELNSVTDNPLVFGHEIISGGNFHGEPLALQLDALAVALTVLAGISERRIDRLVNPALNEELPPFLTGHAGLESGFMMLQVTAAALVAENRVLSHPASTGSITTSGNKEDFVSMGMTSALKLKPVVRNTRNVLAIELLTAARALDCLRPLKSSPAIERIREELQKVSAPWTADRSLSVDIQRTGEWIVSGALSRMDGG